MADGMEDEAQNRIPRPTCQVKRQPGALSSILDLRRSDSESSSPSTSPPSSPLQQRKSVIPRYLQGWVGGRFYDPALTRLSSVGSVRFPYSPSETSSSDEDSEDYSDGSSDNDPSEDATVCPAAIWRAQKPSHRVIRILGVRGWRESTRTIDRMIFDQLLTRRLKLKRHGSDEKTDEKSRRLKLVLHLLGDEKGTAETRVAASPADTAAELLDRARNQERLIPYPKFAFPPFLRHVPLTKLNLAKDSSECEWCLSESMYSHLTFGLPFTVRLPGFNLPNGRSHAASKICSPCCITRMSIIKHSHHGPWVNSTAVFLLMEQGEPLFPKLRGQACDVCTGRATMICNGCPLMVCVNCQVVLDGMCGGQLDELIGALGLNNIRTDACLLVRRPIDQVPTY